MQPISLPQILKPIALGHGGIAKKMSEGDGITPLGRYHITQVFFRADRLPPPETQLPIYPIAKNDGWCDDSHSNHYNQWVRLPHLDNNGQTYSCEELWRQNHIYDLIAVLDYNAPKTIKNKGSAIFIHLPNYSDDTKTVATATAGCIALPLDAFLWLLRHYQSNHVIAIEPNGIFLST